MSPSAAFAVPTKSLTRVQNVGHRRGHIIPGTLLAPIKAPSKCTYFSDFYLLMVFPWGVSLVAMERGKKKIKDLVY